MLTLTRRVGETIVVHSDKLDEPIYITLQGVNQSQAKLGFDAPKDCRIDREEIFLDKQRRGSQTSNRFVRR